MRKLEDMFKEDPTWDNYRAGKVGLKDLLIGESPEIRARFGKLPPTPHKVIKTLGFTFVTWFIMAYLYPRPLPPDALINNSWFVWGLVFFCTLLATYLSYYMDLYRDSLYRESMEGKQ